MELDTAKVTAIHHSSIPTGSKVILDIVKAMARHWSEPGHVCWDKCPCHTKEIKVCEKLSK